MGEERWGVLAMCIVFAVVIGGSILATCIETQWEVANAYAIVTCADLGYQRSTKYEGSFFCVTFGFEPHIIRLGTQAELAGD